jgi:hypothetical protein
MNSLRLGISDESSTLLEPQLHDGRLLGINLPSAGCAELVVAEVNGRRHRILLDGLSQLHAANFREGNIILDVTVTPSDKLQIAELHPLVQAVQNSPQFQEELKRIYDTVVPRQKTTFAKLGAFISANAAV